MVTICGDIVWKWTLLILQLLLFSTSKEIHFNSPVHFLSALFFFLLRYFYFRFYLLLFCCCFFFLQAVWVWRKRSEKERKKGSNRGWEAEKKELGRRNQERENGWNLGNFRLVTQWNRLLRNNVNSRKIAYKYFYFFILFYFNFFFCFSLQWSSFVFVLCGAGEEVTE